ncbi:nucleotidyltransferase domain-containing protein [Flavobacterium sp. SM15]|uniref:nucleotidyltransferase domain-containing protein n=1 Tax=Flavobacterium sp. SM15 TaxID=2908005 RepID=UPI001EDBFD7C|nr:nucleotidyltransferase domain-containing protein [Flavobacterium sp. SM15]MCG2610854.1 nucleotidyltransferase domain-containing protein [Flavobacterium sp. SM15]
MEALKTILYFSIFRYPLKIEEIHRYTTHQNLSQTKDEINFLLQEKILRKVDDFYLYGNDLESVTKRIKGNLGAQKVMELAKSKANFISKFPFVKAVGISGSLSKGYFDEKSDVDFFIITEPNRLWITRTFLILYKKLFLLNSRKYFCINYFISTENLVIEEQNRFTATEIRTLIPVKGVRVFEEFYQKNDWTNEYFREENFKTNKVTEIEKPILIQGMESFLRIPFWSTIDNGFRRLTLLKWKSKFKTMNREDFKIALKSTKNISKHHPSNFQKSVILALNEKYREFQKQYNIELQEEHA